MLRWNNSTECKGESLNAGVQEFYLENPVYNRARLTHELIEALLGYRSFPLSVDIIAMGRSRRSTVYRHPKSYNLVVGRRSQDEMQISRIEPKDDFALCSIKYSSFLANRPCPNQPPLIKFKPGGCVVHSR